MAFPRLNYRKSNKFGNIKCSLDGHSFGSKLEQSVYQLLKLRAASGELEILQTQDHVYLTKARIAYVPDFKCRDLKSGEFFWVEAKGFESPRWPTIKKLWKHYGLGKLEIWKGSHTRPYLDEIICPES